MEQLECYMVKIEESQIEDGSFVGIPEESYFLAAAAFAA